MRRVRVETVRALADVKVVRRTRVTPRERRDVADRRGEHAAIVAIATSTGGPAALAQLVAALPADLPAPVLAVQHNTRGFMPALAGWLNSAGNLRVQIAAHGERPESGVLYLAPDDHHLGIDGQRRIALDARAPIGGFRPSATFLFESVARAYGPGALAVMLHRHGVRWRGRPAAAARDGRPRARAGRGELGRLRDAARGGRGRRGRRRRRAR